MARQDLDDLDVVIRRRGGRYLASMPQVGLYATADTLPAAVESLDLKKKSLVTELTAADAFDQVDTTPVSAAAPVRVLPSLALFAAKGAIVVALVLIAVGYTRATIKTEIDRLQAPRIGGAMFWADMENSLHKAADPAADMPAAKKETLLADLHILVDRWRPFVREIGRLFNDDASPASPQPAKQ
ncbi:MAG TPA: hypothetical protein VH206_22445 [Xanthobacteraceae bacterium]|jgi:hypothetical protein|nr:hypothetical protein [Xanthobacteraceae bacterium]